MRRLAKSNKLNKGFSLIEVLVAMAIIALISIPLLRLFIDSAKINTKAKRLQNATDIAQNVSENFTTVKLGTIIQSYDGIGNTEEERAVCGEYLETEKMLVFKNLGDGSKDDNGIPYFKGSDGEKFYVTVTMNPDEYSKNSDIVGVGDINDYVVPSMGDLFSTDVVTAYSQFTKYDNRILTAFKRTFTEAEVPRDIDYEDIKKEVYVYIDQTPYTGYTEYEYRMTVKYIYCTARSSTGYTESNYYIDYNFTLARGTVTNSEDMPELFLLYTPFDRYDTVHNNTPGAKARDDIFISYVNGRSYDENTEEETKVYIIEQSVALGLNKSNIWLKHHNQVFYGTALGNFANSANPKLNIYSTIDGWPANVTAGNKHLLELYEVNVYVWYDQPDPNDIEEYTKGNAELKDVYTDVSAIKEEEPGEVKKTE